MAGTSIVATICAERLTKFLTRYSKAQASNLRCNMTVESIKQNITSPTVQMAATDRKYLLRQSLAANQFQLPLLEKPKSLDNIYDFTLQRRNIRQHSTMKLLNASRMCLADNKADSQLTSFQKLAAAKARAQALGQYAGALNRELLQRLNYPTMCPKYL